MVARVIMVRITHIPLSLHMKVGKVVIRLTLGKFRHRMKSCPHSGLATAVTSTSTGQNGSSDFSLVRCFKRRLAHET